MRDPAPLPQGADPSKSMARVDAKKLRCSTSLDNAESKVLDGYSTSSWPAPAAPLDNDDILREILLRLPPQPSSLPRASLVCTHWRNILSDPEFLKCFRKHHQKPPLLGFFIGTPGCKHSFVPNLDSKLDRVPAQRFAVPKSNSPYDHWDFRGCRHGLTVLLNECRREVLVWDPPTGQQLRVPFPPGFRNNESGHVWHCDVTVLCANVEDGHVHGDCFLSPLKLVLMCGVYTQAFACLYESTSGVWGNIISTPTSAAVLRRRPSILIGNAVYGLFYEGDSLVFDIERQTLGVMKKPALVDVHTNDSRFFQLLRTDGGSGLGFAILSKLSIYLWERKVNSDGVAGWVLQQKIIQLEGMFPQITPRNDKWALLMGYDEDNNVIVLTTWIGIFLLQLETMQIRKISERNDNCYKVFYPYANFYTAGREVGWKWLDLKL